MSVQNNVLMEVFCECFFEEPLKSNQQNEIMNLLKTESSRYEIEPVFAPKPTGEMPIRVRIWDRDETELIQVFDNRIAFNYIPSKNGEKYLGWDYVLSKTLEIVKTVENYCDKIKWKKIALSYINKITKVSKEEFCFTNYIKCDGEVVPKLLANVCEPMDYMIGHGDLNVENNKQIKLGLHRDNSGDFEILLNNYVLSWCNGKELKDLFEEIHIEATKLFKNIVVTQ